MNNIDIKDLVTIKEKLDALESNDVLFVNEKNKTKYVIMPVELFDIVEDILVDNEINNLANNPNVKLVSPGNLELSYDEYESVKKQIIDAFEKTFKPKPEKLN